MNSGFQTRKSSQMRPCLASGRISIDRHMHYLAFTGLILGPLLIIDNGSSYYHRFMSNRVLLITLSAGDRRV